MINVHPRLPAPLAVVNVRGDCPHCKKGTTFSLSMIPREEVFDKRGINRFVTGYSCDGCLEPIPISWDISYSKGDRFGAIEGYYVDNPKEIFKIHTPFVLDHVPPGVSKEVSEALDCLAVRAYNGFAAMCRRAVQTICTDLGANATTKIENQIKETAQIAELDPEWLDLMLQVMLTGHDGAHPHLPEVTADRAAVLLQLLQDLTHELYARHGKVREASKLRQEVIKNRSK